MNVKITSNKHIYPKIILIQSYLKIIELIMKTNTEVVQSLLIKIGFKFVTFLLYITIKDPHNRTKSLSVRTLASAKYMIAHCKSVS